MPPGADIRSELADYLSSLHSFLFIDRVARRKADVLIMGLALVYALYCDFLLGWSEHDISVQVICIIVGGNVLASVLYWLFWADSARDLHSHVQKLADLMPTPALRAIGLTTIVFLLVANQLPLDAIEPAVAVYHLSKTDIGIVPEVTTGLENTSLQKRFQRASEILADSLSQRRDVDPDKLDATLSKMTGALRDLRLPPPVLSAASDEVSTLNGYLNFSQMESKPDLAIWQPTAPEGTFVAPPTKKNQPLQIWGQSEDNTALIFHNESGSGVVFGGPVFLGNITFRTLGAPIRFVAPGVTWTALNVTVSNFEQGLDQATLLNVTFENSVVTYDGAPTYLGNVRFIHCQFQFASDETSQGLLSQIKAEGDKPVTFAYHLLAGNMPATPLP